MSGTDDPGAGNGRPARTRMRAWLAARDPDLLALRRAGRVTVAVPVDIWALNRVPALGSAVLFGVFSCLALLLFANFSGPMRRRAAAYAVTTVAGGLIVVAGSAVGRTLWPAMAVMAAVALVVGLLGVLRGYLTSAQSVLLLAAVIAVTTSSPAQMLPAAISWLFGGLVASSAAMMLWPSHPYTPISTGLAAVYGTAARAARLRWGSHPDPSYAAEADAARAALARVHKAYDGNLTRPAGLTTPDRAIGEYVDIAERLCLVQEWSDLTPADAPPEPELTHINSVFVADVASALDRVAAHLLSKRAQAGHPEILEAAREDHLTAVSRWVEQSRGRLDPEDLRRRLDDIYPLRLTSMGAELAVMASHSDFRDPGLGSLDAGRRMGIAERLLIHFSWSSPWLRLALRTSVALAVSVGVANTLSLAHSFWIVLGTLVALRFDALGTGRTGLQAIVGTTLGALVGAGLIALLGNDHPAWVLVLPVTLFAAAYAPSTFSLWVAQAAFSVAVISIFTLLFSATEDTARLRVTDVAIGVGLSLSVSLLIWPRGIVAMTHRRCREALGAATEYLVLAFDHAAGGAVDEDMLHKGRDTSLSALTRARETFDLTVAQHPPEAFPLEKWSRVLGAATHADVAAHLLSAARHMLNRRGGTAIPPSLVGPLLLAANSIRESLRDTVRSWDASSGDRAAPDHAGSSADAGVSARRPTAPASPPDSPPASATTQIDAVTAFQDGLSPATVALRRAVDDWMAAPDGWLGDPPDPRPAGIAWIADLVAFLDWNAAKLRADLEDLSGPTPPAPNNRSDRAEAH